MEIFSFYNIIMAIVISAIIIIMCLIKKPFLKAIVYGLPIPITVAFIASKGTVNGSHIVGLFLLVGFLWLVYFLKKIKINILLADVISALLYAVFGFLIIKTTNVSSSFFIVCAVFFLFWILFIIFSKIFWKDITKNKIGEKHQTNLLLKGIVVFFIAFLLLSAKDVLSGVMVTFPFSGVFAVVEMKKDLKILAFEFTKNSIAILLFFVSLIFLMPVFGLYISIILSWVVYAFIFFIVKKTIKF